MATEVVYLSAGAGILGLTFLPLAVPGLLLFVVAPVVLVAVPMLLLAGLVLLPLWLVRIARQGSSSRRGLTRQGFAQELG